MKNLTLALLLVTALFSTCSLAQDKTPQGAHLLRKLEADFAQAVAQHGRDAFLTYFAEDGVEISSGTVTTKDQMRKQPQWPAGTSLTWGPTKAEMSISGDLGYTYGNYVFSSKTKDAKIETETGIYMTVWKRQSDGSWKVVLDAGSPAPAAKP